MEDQTFPIRTSGPGSFTNVLVHLLESWFAHQDGFILDKVYSQIIESATSIGIPEDTDRLGSGR